MRHPNAGRLSLDVLRTSAEAMTATYKTMDETAAEQPITLAEACKLYPRAKVKISTIRTAAERGELHIFMIGNRWHTTISAMENWVRVCREKSCHRGFTSTELDTSGLSETDKASTARAALNRTLQELKQNLRNTSGRNGNRRVGQTH